MNLPAGSSPQMFPAHGERRPETEFVVIIGREIDLITTSMRIDLIHLLAAIPFAVDERYEQASGLGAQQVFQDARLQIVLKNVAGCVLAFLEQSGVAAARGRAACLLDLV